MPDQLVSTTVTALLKIASGHPQYRGGAFKAIVGLATEIVERFKTADRGSFSTFGERKDIDTYLAFDVLSQYAPAFHGLYRAIISIPFDWTSAEWCTLAEQLNPLFAPDIVERLNRLPVEALSGKSEETLVSRYVSRGRPLTGYFIVCCVIEAQWTILAQALGRDFSAEDIVLSPTPQEAEAAGIAWLKLHRYLEPGSGLNEDNEKEVVRATLKHALQTFTTLLVQIEALDTDPAEDSYAWETMSESLKLAAVCSVALNELDVGLYDRLKALLSADSPIFDNLIQEAALKSTSIVVRSFPDIAASMANHLRRFVTSPLSIFEFEFATTPHTPTTLLAAARCLSLCIYLAPGDDLIMSYMYSLLNYIAASSKDIFDTSSITPKSAGDLSDLATMHSGDTSLRGLSEEEKRTVGISTISVATQLALESKSEEVSRLTVSMLLQRMRSAEPTVEAAIAYNLVDLALTAPQSSFIDIIRAFSSINRSANLDDTRFSNNMVLAAQTRLAKELRRRPELYQIYLVELLTLFADKGVAIQNAAIANQRAKLEEMSEQLASLLLPIDALLGHSDFDLGPDISYNVVTLFRNMWFLCVLFGFTVPNNQPHNAMEWRQPALARIAARTPSIVLEEAHDTIVSDLDYNTVIRQEYVDMALGPTRETVIAKSRALLSKHIPLRVSEVRYLVPGQVLFLLAMHDVESMRAASGRPSSLVSYFVNKGINKNAGLLACMEGVAEKVIRGAVSDLNGLAAKQALPPVLPVELRALLVASTHRIPKARDIASRYLNRLITSFPSLMCDQPLVFAILEVLTLLRQATENEYLDEDNPTYVYRSDRADLELQLSDNYEARNQMLSQLQRDSANWFELALSRAPMELHSTLQKYLTTIEAASLSDSSELGASVAVQWAKAIGPIDRKLSSLASMSMFKPDRAKTMASQLASKGYYTGEAAGYRIGRASGMDDLDDPLKFVPARELTQLKSRIAEAISAIRNKQSVLTISDLKRLLFRAASSLIFFDQWDYELAHYIVALPFEAFTQPAISAGIESWSWVIAERPSYEVTMMSEIASAWDTSVKLGKGLFSRAKNSHSYQDPFLHEIEYSPTDKATIDRAARAAQRLLTPHALVLRLLFSRLQAARYRRPGLMLLFQRLALSTHPLSRQARFTFLLFAFETLKSSYLDVFCENQLRLSVYHAAYSWFTTRPQWSYGSNRVVVDADIKVLSEFLSYLQADSIRGYPPISSLAPAHAPSQYSHYVALLKNLGLPVRLLVENEVYRLGVWGNPANDVKRGTDHLSALEKTMLDNTWTSTVRRTWEIDPAIAVHMAERFNHPAVQSAVGSLVRSATPEVLDVPEGLRFLVGEKLDTGVQRDLRYLLLWASVAPVLAITFFERRYNNHPQLLQYAHRVLEGHPVELTFFFVPQVVQALRYDDLGYVSRFIFETAKISQLFCHQIIWNMKANCYRDDAGEMEDPLKPVLDKMTDMVVDSLSGDARNFYDREFGFFNEVTSISGKLKPFIKKTKPEKKAKIDEEMAKIVVEVGVYLPSNPDGKVIDIDKKSGRPLQSHAKVTVFVVITGHVRKERLVERATSDNVLEADGGKEEVEEYDIWQQAIFKVGDDCRQDVLALQVIAMFKNIFTSVGLTLYVFPYRVTATAPCGVIDVVPNATSRDEMGRAKVNDLLDFFVAKYGGEDTVEFQKARLNFIQSMAAYSVVCYILQVKDRHNGNIMIDGEGHIVHIDFGFLFDIDEFGVKFEPNSFKLTHEMVVLMGGRYSQGYQLFQQLTVKAFLAIRPHTDQLVSTVQLMLDTYLPSFKGEPTIKRLKDRFVSHMNERQAADYMMSTVRNAHENVRSTAYDEFQRGAQNDGTGSLILPNRKLGDKFMKLVCEEKKAIVLNGRKMRFYRSKSKPGRGLKETLEKTPYLQPELEEKREEKLRRLDMALYVDKLQFGIFYRPPGSPMTASRVFSNEYEVSHNHRGAGLLWFEYDHKLIRIQVRGVFHSPVNPFLRPVSSLVIRRQKRFAQM
ncbi:atypical/PIKK/PI4K protein kinase [Epithele typhae]|uniref:atypical/PIKK/PI4K protein kinase n=1 Tax=Epithele typhae TaxID=378194 RepID=UPI002007E892|nr:atypical/PIKK/PI4K protein kinase [Epithele typhae]KAH9945818.1 atypical/PIKK/PI4K protein kinase [Epithele typhae]